MMKNLFIVIFLITVLPNLSYSQIAGISGLNPLSEKWVISAAGGFTFTQSDFKTDSYDLYTRIMGEYFFPSPTPRIFGLRAFGSFGYLSGKGGVSNFIDPATGLAITEFRTPVVNLGGGLDFLWIIADDFMPYAYAGASYLYFDPADANGTRLPNNRRKAYSRHEYSLQGELGIRFVVEKNLTVNLSGSMNYVSIDKLDDFKAGRDNDIYFSFLAGLSYYFSGISDGDQDGVRDEDDVCPETPQGVRVDAFGCAFDSDKDGVPDYLDRCPETRANIVVDVDGCPLDSDEDGIADYMDQCINTPENVPVDNRGCPLDSDGDGVPDYKDKCLNTPTGIEVDKFGCQLVTQEKELPKITQMVLSGEVNFEIGKSELLPYAHSELNKLITVLKENPDTRWRVEGHTDNTGSYERNKRLSLERAWSVADYLISKGIESSRLEVSGMGPDYPIANNSTASGRALNRRVSIEMIDGGPRESKYSTSSTTSSIEYNSEVERNVGSMIFTDGNSYCFQLSSWRSYDQAVREVDRLQAQGENAFITEISNAEGLVGTWYRVRIGYFRTLQQARDYKAIMSR